MSLNIPSSILKIAKVKVTIETRDLGVRQHNSLNKMMRTGVVVGNGVPAQLAIGELKARKLPYIRMYRGHWVDWGNVPLEADHPVRKMLMEAYAVSKLETKYRDVLETWRTREYGTDSKLHLINTLADCAWMDFSQAAVDVVVKPFDMKYEITAAETYVWHDSEGGK